MAEGDTILRASNVYRRGARWRKPAGAAWVSLRGAELEAVQFGGPTLRLLSATQLRSDPALSRLGPDVLSADFDPKIVQRRLRASPEHELTDSPRFQRSHSSLRSTAEYSLRFFAIASPRSRNGRGVLR